MAITKEELQALVRRAELFLKQTEAIKAGGYPVPLIVAVEAKDVRHILEMMQTVPAHFKCPECYEVMKRWQAAIKELR